MGCWGGWNTRTGGVTFFSKEKNKKDLISNIPLYIIKLQRYRGVFEMKLNEAIIKMQGVLKQTELAEKIGYKQGALATALKRNNMQVKTLLLIAKSCDYELVLVPKVGNKKDRTYVIDEVGQ